MKKLNVTLALLMAVLTLLNVNFTAKAQTGTPETTFDVAAKSAVLMDAATGTVLYEKNADEPLPPASVTKVMTLLLIMEALDSGKLSLDEEVTVSENAASMGGSQVFLEPGETMRTEELLKCIVIASANDAAVTLAERVGGSEAAFVGMMNSRASELGMKNTHFENVTGLDDDTTDHLISAMDIAIMSRELMKHEKIFDYTTVWTDTVRNGEFGLTNTNRLIRFYKGATGLKTGSTSKAGFCISATAERDGLHLIAVIMGSESRDTRNEAARTLLDYGFSGYCAYVCEGGTVESIPVKGGASDTASGHYDGFSVLLPRGKENSVTLEVLPRAYLTAPVKAEDAIGRVRLLLEGECIAENPITANAEVERIGFLELFLRILSCFLLK